MSARIAVIGAGAFGTALATVAVLAEQNSVVLVGRDPQLIADLAADRLHQAALPGILLPDALAFSAKPDAVADADIVLLSVPSQAQGDAASHYGPYFNDNALVVTCAKGLERGEGRLLTDMLQDKLPAHHVAVLSGPGFAADIAKGLPTAMVVAASDMSVSEKLAKAISGPSFRLYASDDRAGVQLGGALKNVLAIACGIVEGRGMGESARAALISRGLAEMSRLAAARGGQAETIRGLSGLGDLVLTATSHQSRNLRFGIALGRGEPVKPGEGLLVEGAYAAGIAARLAKLHGVEMPITTAVSSIIDGSLSIDQAFEQLMTRPITTE